MELGDKKNCSYMHSSKRDMLSARNTSLYAYGTYHTRMVYKIVPYAYGIKYAYGTEQLQKTFWESEFPPKLYYHFGGKFPQNCITILGEIHSPKMFFVTTKQFGERDC